MEDIKLLPAGHYATFNLKHRIPQLCYTQYWDYNFCEPTGRASDAEYREELTAFLNKRVNRQLVTDVGIRKLFEWRYGLRRHNCYRC